MEEEDKEGEEEEEEEEEEGEKIECLIRALLLSKINLHGNSQIIN